MEQHTRKLLCIFQKSFPSRLIEFISFVIKPKPRVIEGAFARPRSIRVFQHPSITTQFLPSESAGTKGSFDAVPGSRQFIKSSSVQRRKLLASATTRLNYDQRRRAARVEREACFIAGKWSSDWRVCFTSAELANDRKKRSARPSHDLRRRFVSFRWRNM